MISPEEITVSQFTSPDEFSDFQCEKTEYSDFVQKPEEAQRYQKQNLGITYAFEYQGKPVGFVTLAMAGLRKVRLEEERQDQKSGVRDVPSLLLGHWARDSRYIGKGVGKIMMAWVLARASEVGMQIGCRYVILGSEPDMVEHYKKHYSFEQIPPSKEDKKNRQVLMFFDLGLRPNDHSDSLNTTKELH